MKRTVLLFLSLLFLCACMQEPPAPADSPALGALLEGEESVDVDESSVPEPITTATPTGGGSGRIAYHVNDNKPYATVDMRIVDVATGAVQFMTSPQTGEQFSFPCWNPDGSEIVMLHGICCEGVAASFFNLQDQTNSDMFAIIQYVWPASYAPDSERVVFSARSGGEINLFILDRETGEWTQVTRDAPGDISPDWHPSEEKIVFAKNTSGFTNIAVINVDGSGFRLLTNENATSTNPRWSPDGSRIVFESDMRGNDELFIIDADGSGMTNITNNPVDDKDPVWSPDGTHIAFASFRDPFGIYMLDLESGEVEFVAEDGRAPDWAP